VAKSYNTHPEYREKVRVLKDRRANPPRLRTKAPKNLTRVPAHWLDQWEAEREETAPVLFVKGSDQ
jgi:hypothetical protein